MTDTLEHRGPDAGGTFFSRGKLSLGHRRLSIVDLHERSNQPLRYTHAGRVFTLVFNGEIYNFQHLRRQLEQLGYSFNTTTDSEVILAGYVAWGEACVHRFNGMWAFALFDENANRLFLSRDRFGKKPLYYYSSGGRFAFASEIKALLQHEGVRRVADNDRVSDFLLFGMVGNTNGTFFRDVRQLPAGCNGVLELDTGRFHIKRYYTLQASEGSVTAPELRETLKCAVRRRLISEVPVCLSLSGGVDSSSIAALVSQVHDNRMVAFTTVSDEGVGDETGNVLKLLERYPQFELVKVPLILDDFPARLRRIIYHMDEPFIYDSPFVRWSVAEQIRRHSFKVSLTGEGADELLGGYPVASPLYLHDLLRRRRFGRLLLESACTLLQPDWRRIFGHVLTQFIPEKRRYWSQQFLDNARNLGCLLDPADLGPSPGHDITLKEKLLNQITTFFLPYLLACNDKMYMAHSVEARAPFLDVEVAQLCLSFSTESLIRRGLRKYPLRAALKGMVPDEILFDRRKIGFASPMRARFAAPENKEWIRDLFTNPRSGRYIDPKTFLSAYNARSSAGHIDDFLANAVVLELWMREFDVSPE
jgi:asparagine synthase (glutamine-hydrolysing)